MLKIVFFGKGVRAFHCLSRLIIEKQNISLVVGIPNDVGTEFSILDLANKHNIPYIAKDDPNDKETEEILKAEQADLFILGGYGKIIKQNILDVPSIMTLNLHGGKLPEARGSSPLNWALINGQTEFTLSIIQVDQGVDTGAVLLNSSFPINENDTIVDLHQRANREFPNMLLQVISMIKNNKVNKHPQNRDEGAYYPLRFPEDGYILFDQNTAEQIYNKIRALTTPYPCAFIYYKRRKVKLLEAKYTKSPFYGEPGRIYKKTNKGLLVCTSDKSLWLTKAVFEDDGSNFLTVPERYETISSLRQYILTIAAGEGE